MKSIFFKTGLFLLFALVVAEGVNAQRTGRKRNNNNPATQPTSPDQQQQTNNNQQPKYDPYGGLPIRVDSAGMADTLVRRSLRNDNAFDKSSVNARTPLVYEHLRADDALFAEKVWRELDLREKLNQTFRYEAADDNGSQLFVDKLLHSKTTGFPYRNQLTRSI
jgi:hypothetical protein